MTGKCESFEKQNVAGVSCIKQFGQVRGDKTGKN